uniref:hypothetical protein n=1 Tax=Ndongobacter massiliensis TaxID=1871025 RepID=UPI000931BB0C|nr:hypothetical protein [Ndongobacter massiliensis]
MFSDEDLMVMPERFKAENDRLVDIFLNTEDEDIDIEDIIEKYASEEFKLWSKEKDRFDEENLKKGIIYN